MENNIEKYKQLRSFGMSFVNEKLIGFIVNNYSKELVLSSAAKLGMLEGKKTIAFDNENDTQYIFDFALNEPKIDGKNAVRIYKEEVGLKEEMEDKFITALENSYTSLFRVINTSPEKGLVFLKDVLNKGKNIRLTDLGLSQKGHMDVLLFTRILRFEDMTITSGMSCAFWGGMENELLQQYEQHIKSNAGKDESMERFIFFHNAFKRIGEEMRLQEV